MIISSFRSWYIGFLLPTADIINYCSAVDSFSQSSIIRDTGRYHAYALVFNALNCFCPFSHAILHPAEDQTIGCSCIKTR
jgi:hypothetical protein